MILIFGLFSCNPDIKLTEEQTGSGIRMVYKPKRATSSGFEIRIIPQKPEVELQKEVCVTLIKVLSGEFPDKEIQVHLDSTVGFVDCGQGFEKVVCPGCGHEISMDCWQEMMDEASAKDFGDLSVKTTCCHTLTDLNALKYQADCGFAKSVITVIDPDTMSNDSKLLPELKKISGIDFRIIYAHI